MEFTKGQEKIILSFYQLPTKEKNIFFAKQVGKEYDRLYNAGFRHPVIMKKLRENFNKSNSWVRDRLVTYKNSIKSQKK